MVLAAARKINARKAYSRIVITLTVLPVLSFMAIVPGGDAMSSGASASRVWELALCGLAVRSGYICVAEASTGCFRDQPWRL